MKKASQILWRLSRRIIEGLPTLSDIFLSPLIYASANILLQLRESGLGQGRSKYPRLEKVLRSVGVFPLVDHYYEPYLDDRHLRRSPLDDRFLPGINFNIPRQLELLTRFTRFTSELETLPIKQSHRSAFYHENGRFRFADAEYYYSIIRYFKPKRIVEIGSGFSTLLALEAIAQNKIDDANYLCDLKCIEPFRHKFLENHNIEAIKEKVEDVGLGLFQDLEENDILFIDSSHVIKPQGDVLFECQEILPILKDNVLIHIHDIHTPKDYPYDFSNKRAWFRNEQYLVEALLLFNDRFEIIGLLNHLYHQYRDRLLDVCPLARTKEAPEPSSLWIRKKTGGIPLRSCAEGREW